MLVGGYDAHFTDGDGPDGETRGRSPGVGKFGPSVAYLGAWDGRRPGPPTRPAGGGRCGRGLVAPWPRHAERFAHGSGTTRLRSGMAEAPKPPALQAISGHGPPAVHAVYRSAGGPLAPRWWGDRTPDPNRIPGPWCPPNGPRRHTGTTLCLKHGPARV